MSEELIWGLVQTYNLLINKGLTLTMTQGAAYSLASVYDRGLAESMKAVILKTYETMMRSNIPSNNFTTFPLRFSRNDVYFYYIVLAEKTHTGVHIEMLIPDEKQPTTGL
jgi:hypothetical protein